RKSGMGAIHAGGILLAGGRSGSGKRRGRGRAALVPWVLSRPGAAGAGARGAGKVYRGSKTVSEGAGHGTATHLCCGAGRYIAQKRRCRRRSAAIRFGGVHGTAERAE